MMDTGVQIAGVPQDWVAEALFCQAGIRRTKDVYVELEKNE